MVVVSEHRNEVVSIHNAAIWIAVMWVLVKSYLITYDINIFIWLRIHICLLHFGLHGCGIFVVCCVSLLLGKLASVHVLIKTWILNLFNEAEPPQSNLSEILGQWMSLPRRQLKSPRSLSGRSIHLTLVTKWSWSWMTYCHPFCKMSISPPILRYSYLKNLTKTIHGQGHVCGQSSRSCLTYKIQRSRLWSRSDPLVTFEAWSSIHMFSRFVAIGPLLAEI